MAQGSHRVLLVDADLMARARLTEATAALGAELLVASADRMVDLLTEARPAVVVLDLDRGGRDLLNEVTRARQAEVLPQRVVGYYSHIDRDLGDAAREAGCDARARGEFWKSVHDIIGPE